MNKSWFSKKILAVFLTLLLAVPPLCTLAARAPELTSDAIGTQTAGEHAALQEPGIQIESYDNLDLTDFVSRHVLDNLDFRAWVLKLADWSTFSVRGTGQIRPNYSQPYTFYASTSADAGLRLWIDGKLLVDTWDHPTDVVQTASLSLTAGQLYDVHAEFKGLTRLSFATVQWSSASQPRQTIGKPALLVKPDTTAPRAITDLKATAVGEAGAQITFTAPGDDPVVLPGLNAPWGSSSMYEIRYSKTPLTEATWDSAAKANLYPFPLPAGRSETFTLQGLAAGTAYYIGVKAKDETRQAGPLSNMATVTTSGTADTTPPAAVANLTSAVQPIGTEAKLTWTAPGDDSNTGTAAAYDVRFSTSPINEAAWAAAAQAFGEPVPTAPGTNQGMIVKGLVPGTAYHFALRTLDDVGNVSSLSNVAALTTTASPGGYVVSGASFLDIHTKRAETGSVYYAVYNVSQGTPTAAAVKAAALGTTGGALIRSGVIHVTSGDLGRDLVRTLSGLAENTSYYTYLVSESPASGLGQVFAFVNKLEFRQKEITFPTAIPGLGTVHYLAYLPEAYYRNPNAEYPAVLFLHGYGEIGFDINKLKINGPPKLISEGREFPFIVISPQLRNADEWFRFGKEYTDQFVRHAQVNYPVDAKRLYVTGLSIGGAGTFLYAKNFPEKVAAIIPIATKFLGSTLLDKSEVYQLSEVPVWAFTNDQDQQAPKEYGTTYIIDKLNQLAYPPDPAPRYTIYPKVGHDSWTETYNNPDIYMWLLGHSKK